MLILIGIAHVMHTGNDMTHSGNECLQNQYNRLIFELFCVNQMVILLDIEKAYQNQILFC